MPNHSNESCPAPCLQCLHVNFESLADSDLSWANGWCGKKISSRVGRLTLNLAEQSSHAPGNSQTAVGFSLKLNWKWRWICATPPAMCDGTLNDNTAPCLRTYCQPTARRHACCLLMGKLQCSWLSYMSSGLTARSVGTMEEFWASSKLLPNHPLYWYSYCVNSTIVTCFMATCEKLIWTGMQNAVWLD